MLIIPSWSLAYLVAPYTQFQRDRQIEIELHPGVATHKITASQIKALRYWAIEQKNANPSIKFAEYESSELWREVRVRHDPWTNRFQIVERNQRGIFGSDSSFHIYSFGSDGKSESDGNDPDDINSWNYDGGKFYEQKLLAKYVRADVYRSFWITPVFFTIFCLIAYASKKSLCDESPDNHAMHTKPH